MEADTLTSQEIINTVIQAKKSHQITTQFKESIKYKNFLLQPLTSFANQVIKVTILSKQDKQAGQQNSSQSTKKYILKFFRPVLDIFTRKQTQNYVVSRLSKLNLYPQILYYDSVCRLEQFYEGSIPSVQTVTKKNLQDIAENLAKISKIFKQNPEDKDSSKENQNIYKNSITQLYSKFEKVVEICKKEHPQKYQEISKLTEQILDEKIKTNLNKLMSNIPLVPSHNDCHFSNVLVSSNNQLLLLDFQFFGFNYRGYDLGNFFNQYATDYITFQIKQQQQLQKQSQINMIKIYLSKSQNNWNQETQLQAAIKEINKGRMLSHLFWLFIGIASIADPKIPLDMVYYVKRRYEEFMKIYKKQLQALQ